jgi:indole-3-glycerol phosphate synthase
VATYLDEILAAHRAAAEVDGRDLAELRRRAEAAPPTRDFAAALGAEGLSVIAEIKRRSPSKGDLAVDLDAGELAATYEAAGAACLSVLTDEAFFGGSLADLAAARAAVRIPLLRKDFTVAPADVLDARLHGADAILLIVAALEDAELQLLQALAAELGLACLVEVHDEAELSRAVAAGATLIGVNQRDLRSFSLDTARAERVLGSFPAGVTAVVESGVSDAADAERLAAAGFDAVLVGEHLVTASDPAGALRALVGHQVGARAVAAR